MKCAFNIGWPNGNAILYQQIYIHFLLKMKVGRKSISSTRLLKCNIAKIKRITVKSVIFLPRSFLHLKLHNKFLAQGRAFTQIIKIAGFIKYIYAGLWWPSLKMRECSTAHDISHAHAAAHGFLICSEEKNQKISKCQQQLAGKLLILCYLFS